MRLLAVTALLAGCNWVYGIDPTREGDAFIPPLPDAPYPRVQLSYQIATTTANGSPTPSSAPEYAPITPAPGVKIGPIGMPLVDVDYVGGEIIVHPDIYAVPWRLVYTPPGDVPHEIQWRPVEGVGHVIVPRFGRLAPRTTVPNGTGFRITSGHNFANAVAFTTGVWAQTPDLGAKADPVVVSAASLQTLDGASSPPDGVLGDYAGGANCSRVMIGAAVAKAVTLSGPATDIAGTYNGSVDPVAVSVAKASTGALAAALGSRAGTSAARTLALRLLGVGMPAFTTTYLGVPSSHALLLADCPFPLSPDASSIVLGDFPTAGQIFVSNLRQLQSVAFLSSLTSIDSGQTMHEPDFNVPLAIGATLRHPAATLDMAANDGQAWGIPTVPVELAWTPNLPASTAVDFDYFEAALYSVNRTMASPTLIRVYTGVKPSRTLTIDPSVFKAGNEYVFAIRTYRGAPRADLGDFTMHSFPQTVGTIFFRTFNAQ